ncbi:MAG: hypothetical protein II937_05165 [Bacteroidales bacterium]|jgi:hypothetical protein|nr:hypothetical protein [Bacteroidales bacterium]MBR6277337.1 hypothetical protein [Bacteroidales bacterium]
MGLPRFFPENKIHEFQYIPRYYDPVKDEISRRVDEINKELGKEGTEDVRLIQKGTFRRRYERQHKELRQSNLRVFVLVVILSLICYFVNRYFGFM